MNWLKQNWFRVAIIGLLLLFMGGLFYWFAYRPANIRHECSWTRRVNPATPTENAITREEADASKIKFDLCIQELPVKQKTTRNGFDFSAFELSPYPSAIDKLNCESLLKKEHPVIPAKPEEVWYGEATKQDYEYCVREHGLWR